VISTFPRNPQRDYCYDFQLGSSHPRWTIFGEQVGRRLKIGPPRRETNRIYLHIGRHVVSARTGISFLTGTVKNEGGEILKSESIAGIVPEIRV